MAPLAQWMARLRDDGSLQTLTFGYKCNQNVHGVTIFHALTFVVVSTLFADDAFNLSLDGVALPSS